MELVSSATERTTAATDAILALAACIGVLYLRSATPSSAARRMWVAALGCAALASALGAVVHGIAIAEPLRGLLWQPLYLLLGATVALFVVAAVAAWRGETSARRVLPYMLGLALLFYLATVLTGGDFLAFVLFQAGALLFSLGVYLRLALAERRRGALVVALALALSLAAGAIQADESISMRLIWELDHNGVYHLVQLAGLVVLVAGLGMSLRAPASRGA